MLDTVTVKEAILLFGPPGCGKDTQGEWLKSRGYGYVATGSYFRNLRKNADLGDKIAQEILAAGNVDATMAIGGLVSDELTMKAVVQMLKKEGGKGRVIFNGVPRNERQAHLMIGKVVPVNLAVVRTINILVNDNVIVERLLERARKTGRIDDTPSTIRNRIEAYKAETLKALEVLRDSTDYIEIDGEQEEGQVAQDIANALSGALV